MPDHHAWGLRDLARIEAERARTGGRVLVLTTGKDAVKLAPLSPGEDWWVLQIGLEMRQGRDDLRELLSRVMGNR